MKQENMMFDLQERFIIIPAPNNTGDTLIVHRIHLGMEPFKYEGESISYLISKEYVMEKYLVYPIAEQLKIKAMTMNFDQSDIMAKYRTSVDSVLNTIYTQKNKTFTVISYNFQIEHEPGVLDLFKQREYAKRQVYQADKALEKSLNELMKAKQKATPIHTVKPSAHPHLVP